MTSDTALALVRDLRPQAFGTTSPRKIPNPVVEPLWVGVRVLAAVVGLEAVLIDETGDAVDDQADIEAGLSGALAADAVVIDGVLTKQVSHDGTGMVVGTEPLPSTSKMISTSMIGSRRSRTAELARRLELENEARDFGPDDTISLVAVDLLYLDGESLLEIPLLERKRLLEGVVAESNLIRRSAYIRPPIETWVNSWRSLGFHGLTYKAANGHYRPGGVKDDWATSPMPRR
jgi:hypothetical protein